MGFPRKRRSTRCMNYNGMFIVLCFCSRTTDALRSGFLLIPACFVCGFLSKYLFCQIYLHFSSCCLSISSPDVLSQKFAWLHGSKTIGLLLILVFFSFRHALSVVLLCIETPPYVLAQKFAWLHGSKTIGRSGSQQQHPDLPSILGLSPVDYFQRLNTSQLVRMHAIDTKLPWKMLMKRIFHARLGGQKLTAKDDILSYTRAIGHVTGLPQAVLFPYVNICIEPSSV
ncbi:unnamed protein product [Musa hybrid cultivar]